MASRHYDWKAIEAEYVHGRMTQRDLAAKYGMNTGTIGRKASAGDWAGKRDEYRQSLAAKRKQETTDLILFEKNHFDALSERSVDLAVALIANGLTRAMQQKSDVDGQDLSHVMNALLKAQEIKYRALGIPLPKQLIEHSGAVDTGNIDAVKARLIDAGLIQPEAQA